MTGQTIAAEGWTSERITMLKKLWRDGRSASEIAKELGGVTRNAVIGKVHRLGIAEARSPEASAAARAIGAGSRPRLRPPRHPRPARPLPQSVFGESGRAAEPLDQVPTGSDVVRVFAFDQLAAHSCKWPIDLPGGTGFGFCGDHCGPGEPYCVGHKARASKPGQERNPRKAVRDLERSLTRYLA